MTKVIEVTAASADFPTPKVHYETEPARNSPNWHAWAKRFIDKIRTCAVPEMAAQEIVDMFVSTARKLRESETNLRQGGIVARDIQRQLELAKKLLGQVVEKVYYVEDFTIGKLRNGKWAIKADDGKDYFGPAIREFNSPLEALIAADTLKREWESLSA